MMMNMKMDKKNMDMEEMYSKMYEMGKHMMEMAEMMGYTPGEKEEMPEEHDVGDDAEEGVKNYEEPSMKKMTDKHTDPEKEKRKGLIILALKKKMGK